MALHDVPHLLLGPLMNRPPVVDPSLDARTGAEVREVHGLDGALRLDAAAFSPEVMMAEVRTAQRRIVAELAEAVRTGTPHPLDVHRGLHLQRLIAAAAADLQLP